MCLCCGSWRVERDEHNFLNLFMEITICGHELWGLSTSVSEGGS